MAEKRLTKEIAELVGDFSGFTERDDDAATKAPVTVRLAEIELLIQRDLPKRDSSKSTR